MAIAYDLIRPDVEQVKDYVLSDLDRILQQTDGGNYAAAAVITCACDALSFLKYGHRYRGDLFFQELLPGDLRSIAKTLYKAIRDGLVHGYDTQLIHSEQREIDVMISWSEKPHLCLSADEKQLYVNVRNLASEFRSAVARFESELKDKSEARDKFFTGRRRLRRLELDPMESREWEKCLSHLKRAST